jgi:hypothetical protein
MGEQPKQYTHNEVIKLCDEAREQGCEDELSVLRAENAELKADKERLVNAGEALVAYCQKIAMGAWGLEPSKQERNAISSEFSREVSEYRSAIDTARREEKS